MEVKMKKGYCVNDHPDLIPANYDMNYQVGMFGTVRDPLFSSKWVNLVPSKRGIIHQPCLAVDANEYDNASAFKWLLDDLGKSNWDNGNPIIVDIWKAQGDQRFNLDHIRVYGSYVAEYYKPKVKPLLRLNVYTWNAYLQTNRVEAIRLLENFELLLLQPGVTKPDSLIDHGLPMYWEHDFGLYKVDETRQWAVSEPVTTPDPEPDPLPVVIGEQTIIRKWQISLFGGLVKGTITAVDE